MKKITIFIILFILTSLSSSVFAQKTNGDKLIGTWLSADKTGHIHIFKDRNKYFAKATSATEGDDYVRYDTKNPDPSKRNIILSDVFILKDFEYIGDNVWEEGTIYDPNNGKTYSCIIKMKDIDQIDVKGYVGISWFGRSESWTRVKK